MKDTYQHLKKLLKSLPERSAYHYYHVLPDYVKDNLKKIDYISVEIQNETPLSESVDLDDYTSYHARYKRAVKEDGTTDSGQFVGLPMSKPEYLRAKRIYRDLHTAHEGDIEGCCKAVREKRINVKFPVPHDKMTELETKLLY